MELNLEGGKTPAKESNGATKSCVDVGYYCIQADSVLWILVAWAIGGRDKILCH